ncbi:MAG: molecular chaperone TorD family protein [Betaproteobacteria bacterium]|nr:molecular chaperone TorD family protein [Betaproteobacteria bacterium]
MAEKEMALARADVYELFSTAFVYPGKEEVESLQELAADVGDSIGLLPYDIKEEYQAFSRSIANADVEALKPEYTELFLTRMFCPPTETIYGKNSFNTPNILGDISGFYKAFGFKLSDKATVSHDNIAVELEFMSFLELKIAYALEQEMEENLDICLTAKKRFLAEHIGRWIWVFGQNLVTRSNEDYFRCLGQLISKFINAELEFYGIKVDIEGNQEMPQENEPMECPHSSGCTYEKGAPLEL